MKQIPALWRTLHTEGIRKPFSMSFRWFHWVNDIVHCSIFCFIRYEIRCFILLIIIAAKWTFICYISCYWADKFKVPSSFPLVNGREITEVVWETLRGHLFLLTQRSPIKGRMGEEWRKVAKWFRKTIIWRLATYLNSLPLSGKIFTRKTNPGTRTAGEGQAGGLVVLMLGQRRNTKHGVGVNSWLGFFIVVGIWVCIYFSLNLQMTLFPVPFSRFCQR